MITSPLSADRAVAQKLKAGATAAALRTILALAPGAPVPIYRGKTGLMPSAWPHVVIWKFADGTRNHAGTPRLMRDKFRVLAVMRSDKLDGRAVLEDVLEPLCIAILNDLCALTVADNATGGKVWRSHIMNPRFEFEQPLTDVVTAHQMGVEAKFLSR